MVRLASPAREPEARLRTCIVGLMQPERKTEQAARVRQALRVSGVVQGVGFRPHVYRLANELSLSGFVRNDDRGVYVEIEGSPEGVTSFRSRLLAEPPPLASIENISSDDLLPRYDGAFVILQSESRAQATALISPDMAVCADCLDELFDPHDRRYRYPFINCTNCGPRYTIIESIPYDRPSTSMAHFRMCSDCEREYHDPSHRRFHAQPNACPVCGPRVWLEDGGGRVDCDDPIAEAAARLKQGRIAAVKGLGGFHLTVDASNDQAVRELRRRKGREEKPLALMASDVETIRCFCVVSSDEQALLEHRARPIVLLQARANRGLAGSVAPGNRYLGFMLPYTPLHHLLLRSHFQALVMTSGNLSEEPIAIGNEEALARLSGIADFFLLHDREILQRCDDSIVRTAGAQTRIIRRARGYVPEPIAVETSVRRPVLACGGELKNTIALARENKVFLSQHIGDLDNPAAFGFFEHCIGHFQNVLQVIPECLACDLHPGYLSTQWALRQTDLPKIAVQHHHAHLVSVMADNGVTAPTIGLILDGTGYGADGTIWGGEVLIGDATRFERFAWLQPVPMPGGDAAVRQPWRMAASWLCSAFGDRAREVRLPCWNHISSEDSDLLIQMIAKGVNSPLTSSCGRLFDAVSSMLGLCHEASYEAQGAIALEMAAAGRDCEPYKLEHSRGSGGPIGLNSLITAIVRDIERGEPTESIAGRFHLTLADLLIKAVESAREENGLNRVGLSGGVYQNKLFFEYIVKELEARGFDVLTHRRVPTNDGGLALGQAIIADASYADKAPKPKHVGE